MAERISQQTFYKLGARLTNNLVALGEIDPASGIEKGIVHLVKLRVSQINHCCYCQHMHSQEARDDGERQVRLDVLPAWEEAPCFTERERAALAWAEAITLINEALIDDELYQQVLHAFDEKGVIELTSVILAINSWNRISVSLQFVPDIKAN
jgi:AhpD family alkylhydroperoxidase